MSYTDVETGREYEKGPDDFLTDTNQRYNLDGETENPSFDEALWNKEWGEWEAYKAQQDAKFEENYDVPTNIPTSTDHQFTDPNLEMPPVPGGADTPGKGVTAVSTEALTTFQNNMTLLEEPLTTAHTKVGEIDVRPGGLWQSYELKKSVDGLSDATGQVLNKALETMADIKIATGKMITKYTNAEDFNAMTAGDLGKYTTELSGDISGLDSKGYDGNADA